MITPIRDNTGTHVSNAPTGSQRWTKPDAEDAAHHAAVPEGSTYDRPVTPHIAPVSLRLSVAVVLIAALFYLFIFLMFL